MSREFVLPGTRARWAPDRPVEIEHYRIAVAIHPDERRITGETRVRAKVLARELRRLELDAVELEVTAVTEGAHERRFTHDGRTLAIDLGDVRRPGATV